MTPDEYVPVLQHVETQLRDIRDSIGGLHHRIDRMDQRNTREHERVAGLIGDIPLRVTAIETQVESLAQLPPRVEGLAADRERHQGAERARRRVMSLVVPVLAAVIGALTGALASQMFGGG